MKKKLFFLLQPSIIFFLTADIVKVIFRYNGWLNLSIIACCFSSVSIMFVECYAKYKEKELAKVVNTKEQYKDFWSFLIAIMIMIVIIIVFIKGVLLEQSSLLEVIVAEISFVIGVYGWFCISDTINTIIS